MPTNYITEELRAWVGRRATYTAPEPLGRPSIRYFSIAIGDHNPLYTDAAAAQAAGYRDVIAPPTMVCETNQYMTGPRDGEGYIGHRFDLPVPAGARFIRGGNAYELHQPVHPDDIITADWVVKDITEKAGSRGGALIFVVSECRYTNQHGELLAVNAETDIFQFPGATAG